MAAYIAYYCIFALSGEKYQQYVSFCLPFLKMLFKNLIRKGMYYMEDLAPILVVCNVDAFHAMYVSSTLQQTKGVTAVVYILVVDVIQSLVAIFEVVRIVRQVNESAAACREIDKFGSSHHNTANARRTSSRTGSRMSSLLQFEFGVIDYANFLLDTFPAVASHPSVALPRHWQDELCLSIEDKRRTPESASRAVNVRVLPMDSDIVSAQSNAKPLPKTEQMRVECVALVLKMLHMIEFYVLIEFIEAAISIIYMIYVATIAHMPNRIYYKQFRDLTDHELMATAKQLAVYASLELLSFVVFCFVMDRQLQRMSSLQQLAFSLRKEWKVVVPTLMLWTSVVATLSLDHIGMDYTFQFKWLRAKGTNGCSTDC